MKLHHEAVEYLLTDEQSENNAILIGYLTAGLDNVIKALSNRNAQTRITIPLNDEAFTLTYDIENCCNQFDWDWCENLYLLRAYLNFTKKMKRIFNEYYLNGKATSDIAASENCSVRAVNRILKRCKEEIMLQQHLEESNHAKTDNN